MEIGKEKRGTEQRPDVQVVPPMKQPEREPAREPAPVREPVRVPA